MTDPSLTRNPVIQMINIDKRWREKVMQIVNKDRVPGDEGKVRSRDLDSTAGMLNKRALVAYSGPQSGVCVLGPGSRRNAHLRALVSVESAK